MFTTSSYRYNLSGRNSRNYINFILTRRKCVQRITHKVYKIITVNIKRHAIKTYGEAEGKLNAFRTPALDAGEPPASVSDRFFPLERVFRTHCTGDPEGMDVTQNGVCDPAGERTSVCQPVPLILYSAVPLRSN
jgi:hypothetical protein